MTDVRENEKPCLGDDTNDYIALPSRSSPHLTKPNLPSY
jgi:hypothetical protein